MSSRQAISFIYLPRTYFILAVIAAALFTAVYLYSLRQTDEKNVIARVERILTDEQTSLAETAQKMVNVLQEQSDNYWPGLERAVDNDAVFAQVYLADSLLFWNSNQISNDFSEVDLNKYNILSMKNGWYIVQYQTYREFEIVLYKLLKTNSDLLKNTVSNRYSDGLDAFKNAEFNNNEVGNDYQLYTEDNAFLIGVNVKEENQLNDQIIFILFTLFVLCYIFVLAWITSLYSVFNKHFRNEFIFLIFLIVDLILVRLLEYYFAFPGVLKHSFLFASTFNLPTSFESAGDIFISAILLLFITMQFYLYLDKRTINGNTKKGYIISLLQTIGLFSLTISVFYLITEVIMGLPYNSFYGFNIEGVLVYLSLFALIIIITELFSLTKVLATYSLVKKQFFLFQIIVIILITFLLIALSLNKTIVIVAAIFLTLILTAYYYFSFSHKQSFYKYLILILLFAAAAAYIVNDARVDKKDDHQINTLSTLSNAHDLVLENSYVEFEELINKDSVFLKMVSENALNSKVSIEKYLNEVYFFSVSDKFNLQLTICEPDEMLEIEPQGFVVNCTSYFEGFIEDFKSERIGDNLYLITEDPESIYYVGKKHLIIDNKSLSIYFEFFFTYIPEGLGYAELLVNKHAFDIDLSGYSFARYKSGTLVNKFGNYPYLTSINDVDKNPFDELFNLNGYRHLKHKISEDSYLVISREGERLSVQLLTFSVLFVICIIILFVVMLILFGRQARTLMALSFQSRLQLTFLLTISLIITLLAAITLFYANQNNENRLVDQLTEKTNSVIIELQHKLSEEVSFDQIDHNELQYLLRKFSLVFFSDINLYDLSGELISTSRPEIFNKGLLSDKINPMAFEELFIMNKLFYITQEEIGATSYYSSYAPLLLSGKQPAGIINLPYFAKQSEESRSYYLMIFTFINTFVILGIIGTIIAILLSKIITKPLMVLQDNLNSFQIDRRNEVIEWKGEDEIGQLITAYNEMIEKLEYSTELLKQSERESAWREVAQQIAHEIKNPLTPMKLNIQYLEKAYQEKDPKLDEKVKSLSKLLINQIEALNKVAETFSDFAKTKSAKYEKVDIVKVINEAVTLYKSHSNIKFNTHTDTDEKHFTKASEKDLLRLFNNLVKNAIFSIENGEDGIIEIHILHEEHFHQVVVSDNGKGIPDQLKANIFQPYFTTKSKGTGLGLAIVKNIMNEIGGEISFESKQGEGTTFNLIFPAFKE